MGDMFQPIREGNRGGLVNIYSEGLFSWEAVKDDKHRENYLGHSLRAPVGRWQKNKDLLWYGKESRKEEEAKDLIDEIRAIKEKEAEALAEALGYTGGKKRYSGVSTKELARVLSKEVGEFNADELNAVGGGIGFTNK
ncbi:hypothetical protein HK096_000201 [Nowakowskiella sp. JEL0078]|nr:hypothetical protein HK096_000201 [Nowakowskiella sp. JEL0078]